MYNLATITQFREMNPRDGSWSTKFHAIGPDRNDEQGALKDLDLFNANTKLRAEIEELKKKITTARAQLQTALAE